MFEKRKQTLTQRAITSSLHHAMQKKDEQISQQIIQKIDSKKIAREARGNTILDSIQPMNFFFIWGCKPASGVWAKTKMVKDISRALITQRDKIEASVFIPTVFEYLQSSDASFETAQSNQLQHLRLFYSKNVVTKSIGIIFYHNSSKDGAIQNKLE